MEKLKKLLITNITDIGGSYEPIYKELGGQYIEKELGGQYIEIDFDNPISFNPFSDLKELTFDINSFLKFLNEEHLTNYEIKIKDNKKILAKKRKNDLAHYVVKQEKGYYEFQNKECKK